MRLKYGTLDALLAVWRSRNGAFASPEARFLLNVVSEREPLTQPGQLETLFEPGISWAQLEKCDFALAYLWHYWRHVRDAVSVPFLDVCKAYSRKILMMNEMRIHTITQLSRAASAAGVELVFIKGAAELCQFYSDASYLSQRSMGDLDLICAEHDLPAVDVLMKKSGYYLSDYGASFASEQALRVFSIEHAGHLMYTSEAHSVAGCVEVHIAPAVGRGLRGYPAGFTKDLLGQSRKVHIGTTDVRIPSKEHMVVYNICHAASAKDLWVLAALKRTHFDQCFGVSYARGIDLVNARLDASQLEFLFRLRNMLASMGADLDRDRVVQYLHSVKSRHLLIMYLQLAQTFLPDLCAFLGSPQSELAIALRRKNLLVRTSVTQSHFARATKYRIHLAKKLIRASGGNRAAIFSVPGTP